MKLQTIVLLVISLAILACNTTTQTGAGPGNSAPEDTAQGTQPVDERVGGYRNLFEERGHTPTEIDNKVNAAVANFFTDAGLGANNYSFYYVVDADEAYIRDVGNGDIRSEGMSYGMMVAVQTDRRTEFDKLWTFAQQRMRHSSGEWNGCFAWQLDDVAPYPVLGSVSAPDGEEYMAMALYFAWKRWDSANPNSPYKLAADEILDRMLHQDTYAGSSSIVTNFIDPAQNQVVFVPYGNSALFTDPSYHLPAFYELWSLWYGDGDPADEHNAYWATVADASRTLLWRACHSSTGLAPDYSSFGGAAGPGNNGSHDQFRSDAWRVIQNLAVDCAWTGGTASEMTVISRLYDFFYTQGMSSYIGYYSIDGVPQTPGWHSTGLIAMNAVGALVTNNTHSGEFIDALWSADQPTGTWRYYDGCLYLLALLHCAGKYQMYGHFTE